VLPMHTNLRTSIVVTCAAIMGVACSACQADSTGPNSLRGVDGTVSGRTLALTITRDYGQVESFTGRLTHATHLLGFLAIDGFVEGFGYAKHQRAGRVTLP